MKMDPRERDLREKKEQESDHDQTKFPKILSPSSSSRQWSSTFKNPRIARVSRTFGGKDRHSKVCTVRGLRDRRIRLSVPTAIQLYDLQERLGLNQPSKVIDWLIDATEHEIDKLPPLPMIPTNLLHYSHQPYPLYNAIIPHEQALLSPNLYKERERWNSINQENGDEGFGGFVAQLSAHNFFPSAPNWPYNNYFHVDTPNLSLSQFGGRYLDQNSSSSQASSSQIYCPSEASITPTFPLYISPSLENDQFRQMEHLQHNLGLMPTTLHLINPPLKSFSLEGSLHSEGNEEKENRSS